MVHLLIGYSTTKEGRPQTLSWQHSGAHSGGMGAGEQPSSPSCIPGHECKRADPDDIGWPSPGELTLATRKSRQAEQLSYHPDPDPGLRIGPPQNVYHLDWLGHVKGPVLLFESCGISVTQGNNRTTRRSPDEDAILMESQKAEILN